MSSCPLFYTLNVSDPAHPICEPGPVLKVPGVGWVWANRHVVAPAAAAALVVGGGLTMFGVPGIVALGVGVVVFVLIGYGIAFTHVAGV